SFQVAPARRHTWRCRMRTVLIPLIVLVVLVVLAVAQRAYHVPRLPDRVAAHIGPSGEVDRWEDKADAVAGSSRAWLTVFSLAGGIAALSVLAVRFLPGQLVNVPNRDYWVASARRRGELAAVMLGFWLGLLATGVAFGVVLTEEIVRASATGRDPGYML